jgi:hypothetical protein
LRHVFDVVCLGEAAVVVFPSRAQEHMRCRHVHGFEWGDVESGRSLSKRASAASSAGVVREWM